jgi:tripartite-type tricarboxylate transporter receptor subunit TctC
MRRTMSLVLAALSAFGLQIDASFLSAQTAYPAKPVRLIVPYTPGGFTDTMARTVGDKLASALKQPTMIENKPGANGIIGADLVAKSAPDGYTLGMVIAAHSANATLYPKLPFDTVKDFAYVSLVGVTPLILVASSTLPANSVRELIAYAKANPGEVNFASSGIGAAAHLTMEHFMSVTGTKMVHVPYKGTAPALTDLLGGQIGVMFDSPSSMMPHVKSGKIKALGLASDKRIPFAPDVPTIIESGVPGFVSSSWAMLVAPAKTPKDIVSRLSSEVGKIVRSPDMVDKFASLGVLPVGNSPDEAAAFLRAEMAKWGKIIKEANVKLDD